MRLSASGIPNSRIWLANYTRRFYTSKFAFNYVAWLPQESLFKFPDKNLDFSEQNKYKMPDLASTYNCSFYSFIKTYKFSLNFPSSIRKNIIENTLTPKCFLTFSGIKSAVFNFSRTQNKIPWLFPDLEDFFLSPFPDMWLHKC